MRSRSFVPNYFPSAYPIPYIIVLPLSPPSFPSDFRAQTFVSILYLTVFRAFFPLGVGRIFGMDRFSLDSLRLVVCFSEKMGIIGAHPSYLIGPGSVKCLPQRVHHPSPFRLCASPLSHRHCTLPFPFARASSLPIRYCALPFPFPCHPVLPLLISTLPPRYTQQKMLLGHE